MSGQINATRYAVEALAGGWARVALLRAESARPRSPPAVPPPPHLRLLRLRRSQYARRLQQLRGLLQLQQLRRLQRSRRLHQLRQSQRLQQLRRLQRLQELRRLRRPRRLRRLRPLRRLHRRCRGPSDASWPCPTLYPARPPRTHARA